MIIWRPTNELASFARFAGMRALPVVLFISLVAVRPAFAQAPPPAGRCEGSVTWLPSNAAPDGTPAAARELATWLDGPLSATLDDELLDPRAVATLNQRNVDVLGAWRDPLADMAPSLDGVDAELLERYDHIGAKLGSGEYVLGPEPTGTTLPPPNAFSPGFAILPKAFDVVRLRIENAIPVDVVQAIIEPIDLRCIPLPAGLYRGRIDRAFDRNQCSRLHPGDLVRVLRRTADGWLYVRAGHGVGWLEDALLSPPMTPVAARELRNRPRLSIVGDLVPAVTARGELAFLRMGTGFPLVAVPDAAGAVNPGGGAGDYQILIPTATGWTDAFVARSRAVHEGFLPMTRRNVLSLAFARLGDPYGWGGLGGFRDCSGLLLDVAASFDLRLGRNSSVQAQAGAQVTNVAGQSPADKLAAMRAANVNGVVLLYMPGHIMLYLGVYEGRDYALSAISEYLLPCPEGGHRTVRIDRTDVTDLERGRGTERTAFIERITTLAVFGP